MNLNVDAEDDITMDNLFSEQNPNQTDADLKLILPSENATPAVCPEKYFGDDLVKNQLPKLNAEFVLDVDEAMTTVSDLKDIKENILKSNGVSREDAELIDSIATGFISPKKPIGFFTEEKSKTQYKQTMLSLDEEIDKQIAVISNSINNACTRVSEITLPVLDSIRTETVQRIQSLQTEVQNLLGELSLGKTVLPENVNINTFLETQIASPSSEEDCLLKGIVDFPDQMKAPLIKMKKRLVWPNQFLAKVEYLYLVNTAKIPEFLFTFGDRFTTFVIDPVELTLSDIPEDRKDLNDFRPPTNRSLYLHTVLVTSMGAFDSVQTLIALVDKVARDISNRKNSVKEILESTESNLSVKLKRLQCVSSDITKDTLVVISIISFLEELVKFLLDLKAVYESCISK